MTSESIQFERIQETLRAFRTDRGWEMNPKNVAMALNVEAAELLELFQWLTPDEAAAFGDHLPRHRVEEEMADVLIYLLNLAERLDVDLLAAAERKIEMNARKYPAPEGDPETS